MSVASDGLVVLGWIGVVALAVNLAAMAVAGWRLGRRRPGLFDPRVSAGAAVAVPTPPVTIVRPVCGLEAFSEATLASSFGLDHPTYEVIFCAASSADPAIPLVERLIADHPEIPARLLVGDDRISLNPKLNNCLKGWEAARHDWIVLADSNVLMPPDYLERLLAAWRPETGLVCSTPAGTEPLSVWAEVECAFLNTLQARWQYAGEALGFGFAQGKSMLWYRPFLEARGGLRALAAEIAEDAAATKIVRDAGLRVHLVDAPFPQPLGARRFREVWGRQLRWARLRRVTFALYFMPEILSAPWLPAGLSALLAEAHGLSPWPVALGAVAAWYAGEIALARKAGWRLGPATLPAFLLRDLLIPPLWIAAFVAKRIVWRGNAMRIDAGRADAAEDLALGRPTGTA